MAEPFDVAAWPPLSRVGSYEIVGQIGEGGMALVYLARRGADRVALKMIREELARSHEFLQMFLDEAKIVSRLRHPNIVRTFELGSLEGHAFIAMEWLAGQSLLDVWQACRARGVRLRYDMIAWIGARVADGLHYAHELRDERGQPMVIVHRDVNPSNVFVTYDGGIKIIDFGLAKAKTRASRTATGVIKGKLAYMSPEQAAGEPVDRRTDVFALASTLWELACDRRLFKRDDDVRTLEKVRQARVPDPLHLVAGFPPQLWAILSRALARDPSERTGTAAEMARELDAFAGPSVSASNLAEMMHELFPASRERGDLGDHENHVNTARPSKAGHAASRRLGLFALLAVLVVVVGVAAAIALR